MRSAHVFNKQNYLFHCLQRVDVERHTKANTHFGISYIQSESRSSGNTKYV